VVPGSYVIKMGDMMQKWTAGYYRSACYRVVNHNKKPRFSAPFFLNGNIDLKCKALDGSGVETVIGEHIRQRLFETIGARRERSWGRWRRSDGADPWSSVSSCARPDRVSVHRIVKVVSVKNAKLIPQIDLHRANSRQLLKVRRRS
jgi:hypothetical protein